MELTAGPPSGGEIRTLALCGRHETSGLLHAHAGDGAGQPAGEHFVWWMGDEDGDGMDGGGRV